VRLDAEFFDGLTTEEYRWKLIKQMRQRSPKCAQKKHRSHDDYN
jgi:hypothetical protein